MAIAWTRIDDRLIHGQVAMGWTRNIGATVIIVADDPVSQDKMQVALLKSATPVGVRSAIRNIADSAELLNGPKLKKEKVFLVVKGPASIVKLMDHGVEIKKVNVGNMRIEDGKKRFTKEVAANKEEWEAFQELDRRGVELLAQWVPGGESTDFNAIIRSTSFDA